MALGAHVRPQKISISCIVCQDTTGGYALKPESKWRKKSTVEPENRDRPWKSALEDREGTSGQKLRSGSEEGDAGFGEGRPPGKRSGR